MTKQERQEFDTLKMQVKALEDLQGLLLCLGEIVGVDMTRFVSPPEPMGQLVAFTPKRVAGGAVPLTAPRHASKLGSAS